MRSNETTARFKTELKNENSIGISKNCYKFKRLSNKKRFWMCYFVFIHSSVKSTKIYHIFDSWVLKLINYIDLQNWDFFILHKHSFMFPKDISVLNPNMNYNIVQHNVRFSRYSNLSRKFCFYLNFSLFYA